MRERLVASKHCARESGKTVAVEWPRSDEISLRRETAADQQCWLCVGHAAGLWEDGGTPAATSGHGQGRHAGAHPGGGAARHLLHGPLRRRVLRGERPREIRGSGLSGVPGGVLPKRVRAAVLLRPGSSRRRLL